MRRFVLTGIAVLAGFAIATPAEAQAQRIGYINSQRILAEAPGTAEAQAAFESDMSRFRTQVDSLETALEREQASFQRQQATLDEAARRQRQEQLQQSFTQYQQRVAELEQVAQRRQAELVQPIMQRITAVIDEMRRAGNYALIFDASAGGLISADPSLDLTESVLERLRAAPPSGE